ncbi:MAG: hypothetical protein ACRDMX_04615 [Solirubrobacteraceae bacterium]
MSRRPIAAAASLAAAVALALAAAGCGGPGSISTTALRARANRACTSAQRALDRIPPPTQPSGTAEFLGAGAQALAVELAQLRGLHPHGDVGTTYERASRAIDGELTALRAGLAQLRAGDDPVQTMAAVQARLAPQERQADAAWDRLRIGACR